MSTAVASGNVIPLTEISEVPEDVYQMIAEYMVNNLERVRDTLDSFVLCLEGAEKAKAEQIKKQVEDYLEQLKKAKQMSGLQKFFKALGILGFILSILAAVFFPSPATIGLAIASAVLFLEPLLAQATGNESVIEQAMTAVFEALKDELGLVGAAIMSAVVMVAIAAVLSVAAIGGVGAMVAAVNSSFQSVKSFLATFPAQFAKFLASEIKDSPYRRFLEVAQATVVMAQGGVQISMAVLQFEIAKLMKEYDISDALIKQWSAVIEQINGDSEFYQDLLAELDQLLQQMAS